MKNAKLGWKIMRLAPQKPDGVYRTLYQGLRGSRFMEAGKTYRSERKWGTESGTTYYWTGFHVLPRLAHMAGYLRKFHKLEGVVVMPCWWAGGGTKPTNEKVRLARYMQLIDGYCKEARQLRDFGPLMLDAIEHEVFRQVAEKEGLTAHGKRGTVGHQIRSARRAGLL